MPDPAKFKDKKHWMQKCLHQTLHKEKKEKEHGLAQCLNMWRQEHGGKPAPKKGKKKAGLFDLLRWTALCASAISHGSHKTDKEIDDKFNEFITNEKRGGMQLFRLIPDIEQLSEGQDPDNIAATHYPGWGIEDFKKLLAKMETEQEKKANIADVLRWAAQELESPPKLRYGESVPTGETVFDPQKYESEVLAATRSTHQTESPWTEYNEQKKAQYANFSIPGGITVKTVYHEDHGTPRLATFVMGGFFNMSPDLKKFPKSPAEVGILLSNLAKMVKGIVDFKDIFKE
jgi:hypothetical protein